MLATQRFTVFEALFTLLRTWDKTVRHGGVFFTSFISFSWKINYGIILIKRSERLIKTPPLEKLFSQICGHFLKH